MIAQHTVMPSSIKGVLNRTFDVGESFDRVIIPVFQRPYCWSLMDIQKILDDVDELRYLGEKNSSGVSYRDNDYYLGTICFQVRDGNTLELLDGQQRLTSMLILCRVLLDFSENITEDGIANQANELKDLLKQEGKTEWFKAFSYDQPKTQNHIRSIYQELRYRYQTIKDSDQNAIKDSEQNAENDAQADTVVDRFLKTIRHDIERLKFILNHGKVAVTFLTSDGAAEQFFQGENNRGLSLSILDILKAYHMRLSSVNSWRAILEKWNAFSQSDLNSERSEDFYKQKRLVERFVVPSLLLHAGVAPWDAFHIRNTDFLRGLIGTHRKDRLVDEKLWKMTGQAGGEDTKEQVPFDLMENIRPGLSFFEAINHYRKIAQAVDEINSKLNQKIRVDDRLLNCASICWADRFLKKDTDTSTSGTIKVALKNDMEFLAFRDDFFHFISRIRKIYSRLDSSALSGIFGLGGVPNRNLLLLPHHTSTPSACIRELAERTTPDAMSWMLWGKRREKYKEEYNNERQGEKHE